LPLARINSKLYRADPCFDKLARMQEGVFQSPQVKPGTTASDVGLTLLSAILLIISFPDFNLSLLAWIALVPFLLVVAHNPRPWRCFFLGWLLGTVFFYGSCYWLTYSMIHTGGLPSWIAFVLLLPGAVVVGVFPAAFALILACAFRKWGAIAMFIAPLFWPALEWARFKTTGQLWNAIGYSQAYHPQLIQTARWGGVYAVGFLIVSVNVALVFVLLRRRASTLAISVLVIVLVGLALMAANLPGRRAELISVDDADAIVIAIQPNVPMDLVKSTEDMKQLTARHFEMSEQALRQLPENGRPHLVIWPESPMNFTYGTDRELREKLAEFTKVNHTSLLLNSQEAAPNNGIYNSALLINEQGSLIAQYDKIRLLPFGEYVPLPRWVPGAGLIGALVGDFTPGTNYRLMPVGKINAGVFICIESAYPAIARTYTGEGADVLINISNDGYLGPTAVMRQHLANGIFRAVENGRPVLRVTNSGITAFITAEGEIRDATQGFRPEVRTWTLGHGEMISGFYTNHGDLFVAICAGLSLLFFLLSFRGRRTTGAPAS
jgi:apolipoprotein N-acyltransferase